VKRLYIKIILFIISIIFFSFIYKFNIPELSISDCLYVSTSIQSFTGTNIVDKYNISKKIATIQLIISYTLITIFIYTISKQI